MLGKHHLSQGIQAHTALSSVLQLSVLLCLISCLFRFTSVGVRHVVHLAALTMEDYPVLGICTMEDRARLFHLVQMVKTDLENLEDEDAGDFGDEVFAEVVSGDSDEENENKAAADNLKAAPFAKPSRICRRLDFSSEAADHRRIHSCTVGTFHVYASHTSNDERVKDKSNMQLKRDNESAVICGTEGNISHRKDAHIHLSDDQPRGITKPNFVGGFSLYNSHTRLSPKYTSFHKSKPTPAPITSKRFNNRQAGYKDRKGVSLKETMKEKRNNGASGHTTKPTPVYELKTTAGYNYGVPQSPLATLNKK